MVQIKTPDLGSVHNIVESVLYCHERGMQAYQGGTCNETDASARACVHIALAARPMRLLVKPGMGFDEGMNIVNNEMRRTIALLKRWRRGGSVMSSRTRPLDGVTVVSLEHAIAAPFCTRQLGPPGRPGHQGGARRRRRLRTPLRQPRLGPVLAFRVGEPLQGKHRARPQEPRGGRGHGATAMASRCKPRIWNA